MNDLKSVSIRALALVACSLAAGPATAGPNVAAARDAGTAVAGTSAAADAVIEGQVTGRDRPVAKASVYAYEVASYALEKVRTDGRGHFLFRSLPAGMYKIIAYKQGFVPTIALLLRRQAEEHQYVELKMRDEQIGEVRQGEDYWSIRSRLPPDVLRDVQRFWRDDDTLEPGMTLAGVSRIGGEMLANGGLEHLGEGMGEAQYTSAQFELQGTVGAMQLGLNGQYQLLAQAGALGRESLPDAEARSVAVALETAGDAKLSVTSSSGQMVNIRSDGMAPVDLEHYQVRFEGPAGDRGHSDVTAQYTQEANYHQGGWTDPVEIPEASRTWQLKGVYTGELSDRTSLEAGLSYRQRTNEGRYLASLTGAGSPASDPLNDETLGVYGLAGSQILPRVVVEYGLFSSVRDGGMSLMPHGGMVVDLGAKWQARTSFARRVETDESALPYHGFSTAFYSDDTACRSVGEACYEVYFSRGENDESISVGAVHREYAETLRLYFSPDFFNRLESLFVVKGDQLPELQFSMVRRIAPKVLARLESNIASGGGGIFYATDDVPYENQVRYLVTSLDTRFQQTSTGVFVAFHHLEQELNPTADAAGGSTTEVEMQRLQLMLTQDLNVLADFASNWAVRFNVELSRGATPYRLTTDDELHKKLTGGISVSF